MQKRIPRVNIPTEIIRTVLTVRETGSLTKASAILGLTQPALSTQLKRLEGLLGGQVFKKTPNGSQITELGLLVLEQAQKMIEANDQMLALGGFARGDRPVRVGISTILVRSFFQAQPRIDMSGMQFHSDRSVNLAQRFLEGHLDVICLLDVGGQQFGELSPFVTHRFVDRLSWVRSSGLVLNAGKPIPIITWTGGDWMTKLLVARGMTYRIVLSGENYDVKQAAVEAGLGLSALPQRHVPENLVQARETYLPELPELTGLLCVQPEARSESIAVIVDELSRLFFS